MPRAAKTSPISPQMFRHFAVATVAITAVLAILADGAGRDKLKDTLRRNEQFAASTRAERESGMNTRRLAASEPQPDFGEGFAAEDSEGSTSYYASGQNSELTRRRTASRLPSRPYGQIPGMPPGSDVPLDESAPDASMASNIKEENIERLLADSRRRSGSPTTGSGSFD